MSARSLQTFVNRLSDHTCLTDQDRQFLLDLPAKESKVENEQNVVKREDTVQHSCVVISGLLARIGHTNDGGRQITSFFVSGNMPDLQTLMRPRASFGLVAIGASEVARIPHAALREAMGRSRTIGESFLRELTREHDIAAEWLLNIGRRTARERLAHLFCEMAVKSGVAEEAGMTFCFPVTQTILADATGLSPVHVNRSIQALRQERLLQFERGAVTIPDWLALSNVAGFDAAYLHAGSPARPFN